MNDLKARLATDLSLAEHWPALRERRRPLVKWCFLAFAAIIMLNLNGVAAMGASVGQMFSLILFALCVAILLAAGIAPRRDLGPTGLAYFAFVAIYVAIGSLTNAIDSSLEKYVHHLWMLSVGALTVYVSAAGCRHMLLSSPQRSILFWLSLIAMCGVATVFVGTFWPRLYELLPRQSDIRHSGFFLNANNAGVAANIAAVFCLASVLGTRRPLVYLAAAALCGLAVILTFSRTAMVIYAVLLGSTLVFAHVGKRGAKPDARRWTAIAAAVVAAGMFGWFLFSGVKMLGQLHGSQQKRIDTVVNLAQGRELDAAMSNRLPVFQAGVRYWMESPIVGNGLGAGTRIYVSPTVNVGTHNTWLLILVDSGIAPVLLFALFGAIWLREAWRCGLPAVRTVALGYFLVFWLAVLTSHNTLTKRHENVALGAAIGLMAGDRQLRRRQRWLASQHAQHQASWEQAAENVSSHAAAAGH